MAATVVLVHGAWHGAWCWDRLRAKLDTAGIMSVAVELPGHGADTAAQVSLHGEADHVRSVLDGIDGPVVLVGHSYGGGVVTDAGAHPSVQHLVYVAAFMLDEGESASAAAVAEAEAAQLDHSDRFDLGAGLRFDEDGTASVDPEAARIGFYHDCPDDIAQWAIDRLVPQRMSNFAESPRTIAWRHVPSTYVVCTDDNATHPELQRILARRADTSVELPSSHAPFLSMPERLAAVLAQAATTA